MIWRLSGWSSTTKMRLLIRSPLPLDLKTPLRGLPFRSPARRGQIRGLKRRPWKLDWRATNLILQRRETFQNDSLLQNDHGASNHCHCSQLLSCYPGAKRYVVVLVLVQLRESNRELASMNFCPLDINRRASS